MIDAKRVLVIGGNTRNLQKAKALGLEVLYIQKKELFKDFDLSHADHTLFVDYENSSVLLPMAKAIYESFPFEYVISFTETGLIPAAQVNDALGLPGNSLKTVNLLKDKWAMRQHLNAIGFSPVVAQVGWTQADLTAFAQNYGLPMIVKPVEGTGSFGVFMINELAEIERVWQQIQILSFSSFVMEEYLEGPEISVESFSFGGHHVIIGITDKLTLSNFVEIGHSVPAQLDDALRSEVLSTVTTFLNAVGIKEGPSHTEVKLTPKGLRILESHNRVGGDKINTLVEIAYGVDMISLAFAYPFGLTEALISSPLPRAGAAIRFFVSHPGIVREISGLKDVQSHEKTVEVQLTVKVGSQTQSVCQSSDRLGYLITKGADAREAVTTCEQLVQKVSIIVE
ncbi:ATP-grasp domain-containing protein [Scytonema sp. PCC 10023]|uniref:ATP-grasp domain-containing protein n=1 Tax=Scytonema sp. PCC 10023 TaxID=1680591 RepID=UPI0039C75FA6